MNLLQAVIQRLVCLAVAVSGVLLIWAWYATPDVDPPDLLSQVELHDWRYVVIRLIDTPKGLKASLAFLGGGALLMSVGLLGLLPFRRFRVGSKVISFQGAYGSVVIQLDSVEATLNRVVGKMPEVKKITVNLLPAEDNRRVRIMADVLLYKDLKAGARETANRVSQYIADTAINILGVEEVTAVDLNVRGIIVEQVAPALPLEQEPAAEPELIGEEQEPEEEKLAEVEEEEAEEILEPPLPGRPLPQQELLAPEAEEGLAAEGDATRDLLAGEEQEPEGEDAELFLDEETSGDEHENDEDKPDSLW